MTARRFARPRGPLVVLPPTLTTPAALTPRRRVPLEGALNFRDLGGYRTTNGSTVLWGHVYRSDHLSLLTDVDREVVARLGLRTVIDFRLPFEREQRPSRLAPGPQTEHLQMADTPDREASVRMIQEALTGEGPMPEWTYSFELYHDMLDNSGPLFVRTMELLATPGRLPALFHCTGGKDRTGVAAVLLLDLLGVPEVALLDDFELTNLYRTPARVRELGPGFVARGVDLDDAVPILGVVRAAMADAYRRIAKEYGGAETYLVSHGLDPAVPSRLRNLLLAA